MFNLNPAAWNKPFELSAEQMSELGLPVPADSNLASQFKLNVSDVLLTPADANAKPALQLNGQEVTADTLNLSTLLSPAGAPAHLAGTAQIEGQAFNFAVDATLQAMIDHQQHHATMS